MTRKLFRTYSWLAPLAVLTACVTLAPNPPATPAKQTLRVQLVDDRTPEIPLTIVGRVTLDESPTALARDTDGAGRVEYNVAPGPRGLLACAPGYTCQRFEAVDNSLLEGGSKVRLFVAALHLARPYPAEAGPLHSDGLTIRDQHDAPWQYRGFTEFLLFKRFLDGEDLQPLLTERIAVGANVLRVLGMCENIAHFAPSDYGDWYFDGLSLFLDTLAGAGLRVEFVVFADAQLLMPALADQQAHFARAVDLFRRHWNVIGELANEFEKNGVDPSRFTRPVNATVWTAGSGLGDGMPFRPPWDGVMHHGARKDEWPRDGKSSIDLCCLGWDGFTPLKVWVIQDEPEGAAEVAVPGRRANVPQDFYDFGAVAGIYGPGATFHSDAGILSAPLGPVQKACAIAFFAGLRAVSPDAVLGKYTRGLLDDSPLEHDDLKVLRTLCMVSAHDGTCVRVRADPSYPVMARNGWTVASVDAHQSVVHVVR